MYARTSMILVALAVLLAGLAWFESRYSGAQPEPILPIESTVSEQVDGGISAALDQYAPPPLATLTETVDRPLFNNTRRVHETPEVAPPTPTATVAVPVKIPDLSLTAVVIDGEDRVAVVRLASKGAFERLREGDQVEGWVVDRITSNGMRLVRGESAHEIELRSFEAPAAPVPGRAPVRAAASPAGRPARRRGRAAHPAAPGSDPGFGRNNVELFVAGSDFM